MSEGLFFLRHPLPDTPISQGFRFSLRVVKIGHGRSAYLAFSSYDLALLLIGDPATEVVSGHELGADCFADFSTKPILRFESAAMIDQFNAQRGDFSYENLLGDHSPTTTNF